MNKFRTFACDFETSVFAGQTSTEVWSAACVELYMDPLGSSRLPDALCGHYKLSGGALHHRCYPVAG